MSGPCQHMGTEHRDSVKMKQIDHKVWPSLLKMSLIKKLLSHGSWFGHKSQFICCRVDTGNAVATWSLGGWNTRMGMGESTLKLLSSLYENDDPLFSLSPPGNTRFSFQICQPRWRCNQRLQQWQRGHFHLSVRKFGSSVARMQSSKTCLLLFLHQSWEHWTQELRYSFLGANFTAFTQKAGRHSNRTLKRCCLWTALNYFKWVSQTCKMSAFNQFWWAVGEKTNKT